MTYRERVIRGHVTTDHFVQLFDSPESLISAVTAFTHEGYRRGETLLLAITARHWTLVSAALAREGCDIEAAAACGQLTVVDAPTTLDKVLRAERPDPALFDDVIGDLVRKLNRRGASLRIYGEMVDVLAAEGDYRAAQELEDLWNALGEREAFTLFCGYTAVHFGDPRTGPALRQICQTHRHVLTDPRDILGSFLLHASGSTQPSL